MSLSLGSWVRRGRGKRRTMMMIKRLDLTSHEEGFKDGRTFIAEDYMPRVRRKRSISSFKR